MKFPLLVVESKREVDQKSFNGMRKEGILGLDILHGSIMSIYSIANFSSIFACQSRYRNL